MSDPPLFPRRPMLRERTTPRGPAPVVATFVGGPRHGQKHQLGPNPPESIHIPTPEGTHLYRQTSLQRRPIGSTELTGQASYRYWGIVEGSDEPDEVGMRLIQALVAIQTHVREATALSPGSVMLPEDVLPGVTKVMGLDVVRGDRVALLLELM